MRQGGWVGMRDGGVHKGKGSGERWKSGCHRHRLAACTVNTRIEGAGEGGARRGDPPSQRGQQRRLKAECVGVEGCACVSEGPPTPSAQCTHLPTPTSTFLAVVNRERGGGAEVRAHCRRAARARGLLTPHPSPQPRSPFAALPREDSTPPKRLCCDHRRRHRHDTVERARRGTG